MGLGEYPIDYDRKIHGPYDPSRYYGKPDTPFGQVKLGEVGQWLGRRNKTPKAFIGSLSRFFWRWNDKYALAKKSGIAPYVHVCVGSMLFFYIINYGKITKHRNAKYHW
ncbi:putative ATP synthase subunit f, mitochondrial [Armadillidium vulgare]|nr:putative ATP synthase subunit f, mitochondrial [Armadillidium vulgare]